MNPSNTRAPAFHGPDQNTRLDAKVRGALRLLRSGLVHAEAARLLRLAITRRDETLIDAVLERRRPRPTRPTYRPSQLSLSAMGEPTPEL